jgi:hypothetical protein
MESNGKTARSERDRGTLGQNHPTLGRPWAPCSLEKRQPDGDPLDVVTWGVLAVAMWFHSNFLMCGIAGLMRTGGPFRISQNVLTFPIIMPLANIVFPGLLFLCLRPLLTDYRRALRWVAIAAAAGPFAQLLHLALLPGGAPHLLLGLVAPYALAGALALRRWPK